MKALQSLRRHSRLRRRAAVKPARADSERAALSQALGYPVQAKADPLPERQAGGGIAMAKTLATRTPGGRLLPAAERSYYETRFGADLGTVRLHTDAAAADLSARLRARAFTAGPDVYFAADAYRPDSPEGRFLIAHELTHVLQQRKGVQVEGGMGRVGDAHERQADAVAARVARGSHAGEAGLAGAAAPAPASPVVQRYAEITGQVYDRLSDDGKMAVKDHKRDAWAESANITKSNQVLDGLKSKVKIEELSSGDVTVTAPADKKVKKTLKKFRMIDRAGGGEASLVDDCGGANQQILGSETHGYESFVGVSKRRGVEEYTSPSKYEGDDNAAGGLVSTTERMSGEIYVLIFKREFNKTLSRTDALTEWANLSQKEQDRLSKKYGINQFAVPKVGQGITIGSERDMPGASESGYNFHFGYNLMASGHDYITLEDYDSSNVKYYFDMYGPESKGQAWAQASSNYNAVDDNYTVMVVQHPESLKGKVNASGVHFEDDPGAPTANKTLDQNTEVVILRKGVNWMKVEVKTGPRTGQSGWILNKYFTGN